MNCLYNPYLFLLPEAASLSVVEPVVCLVLVVSHQTLRTFSSFIVDRAVKIRKRWKQSKLVRMPKSKSFTPKLSEFLSSTKLKDWIVWSLFLRFAHTKNYVPIEQMRKSE